jgi:hypothetical protein
MRPATRTRASWVYLPILTWLCQQSRGAPHLEDLTVQALDDLNRRILAVTGHRVNLRTLLPVGLAGLGLALTLKHGLGLGMLPGWLPLWLAFDAFVKLHPRKP